MTPAPTRAHLRATFEADAVAYFQVLALAAETTDPEAMRVLTSVADRIKTQAYAHLDFLDREPVELLTDQLVDYAVLAREAGAHEEAEWLETCARANRVHIQRIEQVTS